MQLDCAIVINSDSLRDMIIHIMEYQKEYGECEPILKSANFILPDVTAELREIIKKGKFKVNG